MAASLADQLYSDSVYCVWVTIAILKFNKGIGIIATYFEVERTLLRSAINSWGILRKKNTERERKDSLNLWVGKTKS